jgi:hypothetical protein
MLQRDAVVVLRKGPWQRRATVDAVTTLIEAHSPSSWQDLETGVARILTECGYEAEVQKNVDLARGDATIDVWADDHSSPQNIIAVECKHWARPATKSVVHAFRSVVGDSGANTGFIVSSAGFQKGAIEAAAYSNVRLLDWNDFQAIFAVRWFKSYMSPTLAEQTDSLHEYTEPYNSQIVRSSDSLSEKNREQFGVLRDRYWPLAVCNFAFHPVFQGSVLVGGTLRPPALPLRFTDFKPFRTDETGLTSADMMRMPDDVLDAPALRPLMDALVKHSRYATAEFDAIFGTPD